MTNKMERFTQRARRVLALAQEAAEAFEHNVIDPGHIWVGLYREDGGVAGEVLRELGVRGELLESAVRQMPHESGEDGTPVQLSEDTKQALEQAVSEARRLGHHYIGTEHLLLGLLRLTTTEANNILDALNLEAAEIRKSIRNQLESIPQTNEQETEAGVASTAVTPERARFTQRFMTELDVHFEVDGEEHDFFDPEYELAEDQFRLVTGWAWHVLNDSNTIDLLTMHTYDDKTITLSIKKRDGESGE